MKSLVSLLIVCSGIQASAQSQFRANGSNGVYSSSSNLCENTAQMAVDQVPNSSYASDWARRILYQAHKIKCQVPINDAARIAGPVVTAANRVFLLSVQNYPNHSNTMRSALVQLASALGPMRSHLEHCMEAPGCSQAIYDLADLETYINQVYQ